MSGESSTLGRVYTDPNEPWTWAADNGVADSPESAKTADTVRVNGDDTITMEVQGGTIHWVLKDGKAWKDVYAMFEEVKPTFERTEGYIPSGFSTCLDTLEAAKKKLKPVESLESRADELLSIDVGNPDTKEDKENLQSIFGDTTSDWQSIEKISSNLAHWDGRAAELFKGIYIDRLPSILTGQMLVAEVLRQTLQICESAYVNVYKESQFALTVTYQLLEGFPDTIEGQAPQVDWKTVLGAVSGAATVVAGAAAPIPVVGTGISSAATIVAGGASLGSMITESPTHKELEGKPAKIKGGTVIKIMDNFHKRLKRFLEAVENSESELKKWLTMFMTSWETGTLRV